MKIKVDFFHNINLSSLKKKKSLFSIIMQILKKSYAQQEEGRIQKIQFVLARRQGGQKLANSS